jgi:cold shock CspA family protein
MKLRNVLTIALTCSALVLAAGNKNGMGEQNGQNGSMDTTTISGTVRELNTTDSMLVLQTDNATDTLYITSNTQMPPEQQLSEGSRVEAKYVERGGRKELTSVKTKNAQGTLFKRTSFRKTTSNGSNGQNGQSPMKLTGTIEELNINDSTIVIRSEGQSETIHYDKKTKMNLKQLTQGTRVEVKYKEMQDRKVATEISTKKEQNGQNGKK